MMILMVNINGTYMAYAEDISLKECLDTVKEFKSGTEWRILDDDTLKIVREGVVK